MSEPWLPWVVLRSSRLQRRLNALALSTSAMTSALLVFAACRAQTAAGWAAAAVAIAATAAAFAISRHPSGPPPALRIDPDGRISTRLRDEAATAEPLFVSPWLTCLRVGPRRLVPVWRDALDDAGYRRLAAAGRWQRRRAPDAGRIAV